MKQFSFFLIEIDLLNKMRQCIQLTKLLIADVNNRVFDKKNHRNSRNF